MAGAAERADRRDRGAEQPGTDRARSRTTQALASSISRWVSASGLTIDTGTKGAAAVGGRRDGDGAATGPEGVRGPAWTRRFQ